MCEEGRFEHLLGEGAVFNLTTENKKALQDMLQITVDTQEDCPVYIEMLKGPVITVCTHNFCFGCIEKTIDLQHKCPICRTKLDSTDKLVRPAVESSDHTEIDKDESSSKIEALLHMLQASAKKEGTKTVVFGSWTLFYHVL